MTLFTKANELKLKSVSVGYFHTQTGFHGVFRPRFRKEGVESLPLLT